MFLLISDKAGCSPEMIRLIKDELIYNLSKYMDIEKDHVRLHIDQSTVIASKRDSLGTLYADIPIRSISNKGLY
jgi:cell division topological specificity factor